MERLQGGKPGWSGADCEAGGNHPQEAALVLRLEQLQAAMSDAPPLPVPAAAAKSVRPARRRMITRVGLLLLALAMAALAGGGLAWLREVGVPARPAAPLAAPSAPTDASAPAQPQVPVEAQAAKPVPAADDETLAHQLLEAWRQAWSNRDVAAYLASYTPDFTPADGQGHADWAAARRKNLESRREITVHVADVRAERLDGERIKLTFLQDYAAANYREKATPKTLLLVRLADGWRIAGEWQGTAPAGLAPAGPDQPPSGHVQAM